MGSLAWCAAALALASGGEARSVVAEKVVDVALYRDSHFRDVAGCVDAYLTPSSDGRFREAGYALRTREAFRASEAPEESYYKDGTSRTLNGTRFVYLVNRKAASRTMQDIAAQLRDDGPRPSGKKDEARRVVVFTFARDPLRRLQSGYAEVVSRHVDGGRWCLAPSPHRWDRVCTHPYVKHYVRGSRERFEAFLNATLLGPVKNLTDDAMSYHVLSQGRQFARVRNVGFVGKIEHLRRDVLQLVGLAVDDPEAFVASRPRLAELLDEDETNWSNKRHHPFRAFIDQRERAEAKLRAGAAAAADDEPSPMERLVAQREVALAKFRADKAAAPRRRLAMTRVDRLRGGPSPPPKRGTVTLRSCSGPACAGARKRTGLAPPARPRAPIPRSDWVMPSAKNKTAFLAELSPFARDLILDYYRQDAACFGYDWPGLPAPAPPREPAAPRE